MAGVVVGFVISMPPLGPTYFAVIERALKKQFANAVAIGAGAAFLDMVYVLVAFGGVSAVISLLPEKADRFLLDNENLFKILLAVFGCIIVIVYGLKMMFKSKKSDLHGIEEELPVMAEKVEEMENKIHEKEERISKFIHLESAGQVHSGVIGSFLLGIGFCLSSVTLPASWLAIVGYLKSYGIIDTSFSSGLMLGLGVLIGTTLWFYLMARLLDKHTDRIKPNFVSRLNFSTGLFLVLLGAVVLIRISTDFIT